MGGMTSEEQKQLAAELFNRTWTLLERTDRTAEDDAAMIHTAHASCYHWLQVGEPVNAVRGEWQCSRVYAVLGRAEPALFHATQALAWCEANHIGDFDLAFCYEALARAHAVAGDGDEARGWAELARLACDDIAEDDARVLVLADLDSIPLGDGTGPLD
jgi:hypothetical protein